MAEPCLDLADHVEAHRPGTSGVAVPRLVGELDTIIGENGVDLTEHRLEQVPRNSQAVFPSAVATSWATANLAVRSMPTNRQGLPSAVCASALAIVLGPVANNGSIDVNHGSAQRKKPMGYRLGFWRLGLSPSTPGSREMPCYCRHLCNADRVRCGTEGCKGWRQSSSGKSV